VRFKINFTQDERGVIVCPQPDAPPQPQSSVFQLSGNHIKRELSLCSSLPAQPVSQNSSFIAVKRESNRNHVVGRFVLLPYRKCKARG
jgi:hypothetical protein